MHRFVAKNVPNAEPKLLHHVSWPLPLPNGINSNDPHFATTVSPAISNVISLFFSLS